MPAQQVKSYSKRNDHNVLMRIHIYVYIQITNMYVPTHVLFH